MYPADVCSALERAGFKIILSAPSKSPAWPICEQKRNLITSIKTFDAEEIDYFGGDEKVRLLQKYLLS